MLEEIFGKHSCQLLMSHAHTLKLKTGNNAQLCRPLWLNCCVDWIWCIMLIEIKNINKYGFILIVYHNFIVSNGIIFCDLKLGSDTVI